MARNKAPTLTMLQKLNANQAEEIKRLKERDGGGTSGGGMEARLAKLEAQMEHVQSDLAKLASVPSDLASMKAEVVTKDYLTKAFDRHLRWTLGIVGLMLTVATFIIKTT